MTFWEDFTQTSKSGVFWALLGLCILGIAFCIFLIYKGKDKIADLIITIPFSLMFAFGINLLARFLLMDINAIWRDYAVVPGAAIVSFTTSFWLFRRFLLKIAKSLYGWIIGSSNR